MKECNHRWYHPFNILTGVFVSYAYKCRLCDEVIISDNGTIPELEEKIKQSTTKGKHLNARRKPEDYIGFIPRK